MIALQLFGFQSTQHELLQSLSEYISARLKPYNVKVSVNPTKLPVPQDAFVSDRYQYRATPFMETLERCFSGAGHTIGLVNFDLFVPYLSFIFGIAHPGGNALVALPRLNPIFYGHSENNTLFFKRIVKEVLHEFGHVLELPHCKNNCVMMFSNTLNDTDTKPETYCKKCSTTLKKHKLEKTQKEIIV